MFTGVRLLETIAKLEKFLQSERREVMLKMLRETINIYYGLRKHHEVLQPRGDFRLRKEYFTLRQEERVPQDQQDFISLCADLLVHHPTRPEFALEILLELQEKYSLQVHKLQAIPVPPWHTEPVHERWQPPSGRASSRTPPRSRSPRSRSRSRSPYSSPPLSPRPVLPKHTSRGEVMQKVKNSALLPHCNGVLVRQGVLGYAQRYSKPEIVAIKFGNPRKDLTIVPKNAEKGLSKVEIRAQKEKEQKEEEAKKKEEKPIADRAPSLSKTYQRQEQRQFYQSSTNRPKKQWSCSPKFHQKQKPNQTPQVRHITTSLPVSITNPVQKDMTERERKHAALDKFNLLPWKEQLAFSKQHNHQLHSLFK